MIPCDRCNRPHPSGACARASGAIGSQPVYLGADNRTVFVRGGDPNGEETTTR